MKKIVLILICCLILTGCNKEDGDGSDILYEQYREFEQKLNSSNEFLETTSDFAIRLIVNKVENEKYRYDIVIDTPAINMYHLQAITKVAGDNNESLPTLGILEDNIFSLVPGVVDKPKGIYKGVNLSGITNKSEFTVLIYLTFSLDEQYKKKEERYIKLYGNAS